MAFVVVNVGTEQAHCPKGNRVRVYPTERGAKISCTRLNTEYAFTTTAGERVYMQHDQWQVVPAEVYSRA